MVHHLPWIIVEGFRQAEKRHGLRYIKIVGDGDSSVYPSLISSVPVWGRSIRKIECANHAVKCYRSSLEKLVHDKPKYKGKRKLTEGMRRKLASAARCAIKIRSAKLSTNKRQAIDQLQKDLHNSPLHCFGYRNKCSSDYCKAAASLATTCTTEESESLTDFMANLIDEQTRFWNDAAATSDDSRSIDETSPATPLEEIDKEKLFDVQSIVARLVAKAENLIGQKLNIAQHHYYTNI